MSWSWLKLWGSTKKTITKGGELATIKHDEQRTEAESSENETKQVDVICDGLPHAILKDIDNYSEDHLHDNRQQTNIAKKNRFTFLS
ncbi:MAG: hypothetical protein Q8M98_08415 [Candidatus Cloacimonadaceae bacterium]|nr:hypothetical protein [Candidatus Cloacimonadaceae bacterium]MDP3114785.1 hypothetical protein [Candidatus Cloacimonadaceae bacterium]